MSEVLIGGGSRMKQSKTIQTRIRSSNEGVQDTRTQKKIKTTNSSIESTRAITVINFIRTGKSFDPETGQLEAKAQ